MQGDYLEALAKCNEALRILEEHFGPDHRKTKIVRENRDWAKLQHSNRIGVGYIKQAKADSALIYLQQALLLSQHLNDQVMVGFVLNNLGSAQKSLKHWSQAEQYLLQSLAHNRSVQGDSASVLAYTYFHLAGVADAQSQFARAREYAQKSLALAERHKLAELQKEVEALLRQVK